MNVTIQSTAQPGASRPVGRRRLLRRWILGVILALPLLLGIVYLLRGPLLGGPLARFVSTRLAAASGRRVSIERIDGSLLFGAVIHGLRVDSGQTDPAPHLSIERLEITYGLIDLWRRGPLPAIREIDATGLDLDVDLTAESGATAGSGESPLSAIPDPLPRISLAGKVALHLVGGVIRSDQVMVRGGGRVLAVDLEHLELPPSVAPGAPTSLSITIERTAANGLRLTSDRDYDGIRLAEARWTPSAAPGSPDSASIDLALHGVALVAALRDGVWTIRTDGLDLSQVPKWVVPSGTDPRLIPRGGRLTADVALGFAGADGPEFRGSATIHGLQWTDVPVDTVAITGRWAGTRGEITTLDAALGTARIEARQVTIDARVPWWVTTLDRAVVSVPDAAATLAALPPLGVDGAILAHLRAITIEASSTDGRNLSIAHASVALGEGTLELTGHATLPAEPSRWQETTLDLVLSARAWDVAPFVPLQQPWPKFRATADVDARVAGSIAAPRASLSLTARDVVVDGRTVDALRIDADLAWPIAVVTKCELRGRDGSIQAHAQVDLERLELTGGQFEATLPDLGLLHQYVPAIPLLQGQGRLSGTVPMASALRTNLAATVTLSSLAFEDLLIGACSADVKLDGHFLRIDDLTIEGPAGTVSGDAALDLDAIERATGAATFALSIADLAPIIRRIPGAPVITGAVSLRGHLAKSEAMAWTAWTGGLSLRSTSLAIASHLLTSVAIDARKEAATILVSDLTLHEGADALTASGSLQPTDAGWHLDAKQLDVDWGGRRATLREAASIDWNGEVLSIPAFVLAAGGGELRGRATIGDQIDVDLAGTAFDLEGLNAGLAGRAAFHLTATGSAQHPLGALHLESADLRRGALQARVDITLRQTATGIALDTMQIDGGDAFQLTGTGTMPFFGGLAGLLRVSDGESSLHLTGKSRTLDDWGTTSVPLPLRLRDVTLAIDGHGEELTAVVSGHDLGWTDAERSVAVEGTARIELRLGHQTSRVDVTAGDGGPVHVAAWVEALQPLDLRHPPDSLAQLAELAVRGQADVTTPDLSLFAKLIPDIETLQGSGAAHLKLAGQLSNPQLSGDATVDAVSVRFRTDFPAFDGSAHVTLANRTVTLDHLDGRLGYAPITASGAVTFATDGKPTIQLHTAGQNVLLLRSEILRIRADVDADVQGPIDALKVKGTVRVTNAAYTRPIALTADTTPLAAEGFKLFQIRDPRFARMRFDVHATADNSVRIDNGMVRSTLSGDVFLRGTGESPHLEGRIATSSGLIRLPFAKLHLDQAEIVFRAEESFAPKLEATAHARIRTYDLSVRVAGVIPDVELTVASLPPLPQKDAVLLLAAGVAPADLPGGAATWSTLQQTGTLAGSKLLSQLVGSDDDDEESALDRFSFETGHDGTQGGATTLDAEFKLSERFFLRAERDRYNDTNLGVVLRFRFR